MSESAYFSYIRPDDMSLAAAAQLQQFQSHMDKVTAGDQNALRLLSDKMSQVGPGAGMLEWADASLRKGQSVQALVAYAWLMDQEEKKGGLDHMRLKSKFESAGTLATHESRNLIGKSTDNFRTAMNKELRQTWCSKRVQRLLAYREAFNQLESDWFKTRDMVTNFFA